ncbi:MAG: alanine racemase [Victivallales bacterium]|nr:alanine racemase [Victivallales bacterium]MCF7889169.1 alanine racemase [Victivallales bacterium]
MRRYPITAEIDLNALKQNVKEIRDYVGQKTKIIAVVKANAYGHGIVKIARAVLKFGADSLAVARASEALQLRKNNISSPVLVFGYTTDDEIDYLIINNVTFTVFDYSIAQKISVHAGKLKKTATVHIKIDTGMSRLGFVSKIESVNIIKKINKLPGLFIEGIYTHFADADNYDKTFTFAQISEYKKFLGMLKNNNINIPVKHAANSAGIIDHPDSHFDAVRPGIALYGLYPSEYVNRSSIKLKPVMKLKVEVAQTKIIPKGTKVGYGCNFTAYKDLKIAILPIGYADGLTRMLKNGEVLINGKKTPVIGTICMDQCMVNIDKIPKVNIGDEAVIIGSQIDNSIHAEDIAEKLHTINYEIVCMISFRIPRTYING